MLITPEEIASLPDCYSQDHLGENAIAHVRLGSDTQVVMAYNSYGKGLTAIFSCYN